MVSRVDKFWERARIDGPLRTRGNPIRRPISGRQRRQLAVCFMEKCSSP
jgi:hypothetical protein